MRLFRVFSREGEVHSTSEVVPGLEHALAWQPSGAIIASTERLPNKHQVKDSFNSKSNSVFDAF